MRSTHRTIHIQTLIIQDGARHPNFRWGNNNNNNFNQARQQGAPPAYQPKPQNSGKSLEELVNTMAANNLQFQQLTQSSIHNLEKQVSQLATAVNRLENQNGGKIPSQTEVNPKNVSAIHLRSGKTLKEIQSQNLMTPQEEEKEVEYFQIKRIQNRVR